MNLQESLLSVLSSHVSFAWGWWGVSFMRKWGKLGLAWIFAVACPFLPKCSMEVQFLLTIIIIHGHFTTDIF